MTDETTPQNPWQNPDMAGAPKPEEGQNNNWGAPPPDVPQEPIAPTPYEPIFDPAAGTGSMPNPEPEPVFEPVPDPIAEPIPEPAPQAATEPPSDAGPGPSAKAPKEEAGNKEPESEESAALREPFPFIHLLFAVFYGIVTSFVFWIVILLALLQFVTIAIAGEKNDELQQFSRRVATYMKQMFDYMTLASDERPFPFGPFPKD
jgi:hypothetical protein